MQIRDATTADAELLYRLLLDAFNWTGEARVTREQMLADPHTDRYLGGWMRPGDFGLVAADKSPDNASAGVTAGDACGAIWARPLPSTAPGYGYVADDIPEIGMAVLPEHRGRRVGSTLLTGCVEQARELGHRALSLSVEDGNTAARALYSAHGFSVVGRQGDSDTMLLELRR